MGCFTPFYVRPGMYVPCGKCYGCRTAKRQAWCFRMFQELRVRPVSFFVTFTYDENSVPNKQFDQKHLNSYKTDNYYTLSKDHASDLIRTMQKELRKRFKDIATYRVLQKSADLLNSQPIYKVKRVNRALVRYYLIGEYGDKCHITHGTNRPHYHALLYFPKGCSEQVARDVIRSSWSYGTVDIQAVTFADINYVAKHQFKECQGNDYQRKHAPIFATMSRYKGGLGSSYMQYISRRNPNRQTPLYCLLNGFRIPLPQFYRKKLFPDKMADSEMSDFCRANRAKWHREFSAAVGVLDNQEENGIYYYKEFRDIGFSLSNFRWYRYSQKKFTRRYVRAKLSNVFKDNKFVNDYVRHIQSKKAETEYLSA